MFDFVLTFFKSGADYLLSAESPFLAGQAPPVTFSGGAAVGQTEVSYSSPLTREAFLTSSLISSGARETYRVYHPVQLGQALYQRVFAGEVGSLFNLARGLAREERSGLRIVVKSWRDPEIHNLPWELLHDGRRFLAQSVETPVVRSLEQRRPVREFRIEPPLRVLLTTACPEKGGSPLDLLGEEKRIKAALAPLQDRALLVIEHQVSLERLRFLLYRARAQGRPFQVWHHAGHGGFNSNGLFFLPLTNLDSSMQEATVSHLEEVLTPCEELRLAVLNVCSGATAAGLATALADLSIPAVLGFRETILDSSALVFAETLYQNLAETTLERAVSRARLELRDAGFSAEDWSYPLLFARTMAAGPWM